MDVLVAARRSRRTQRPAKRRRRAAANPFLDEEAEVDDEDEERDEEEDEEAEEVHPDDLEMPATVEADHRRHRELDLRRQADAQKDAEQVAAELDARYRRREMPRGRKPPAITQMIMPTVNDPQVWAIKVRPSRRHHIITGLRQRVERANEVGKPYGISSVFELGGKLQNEYVYCEAQTKHGLVDALEIVADVLERRDPTNIAVQERHDLIKPQTLDPIETGMFVRMLRPWLYRDDLAKVMETAADGLTVTVSLVPRLDYGLNEAAMRKRQRGAPRYRPPKRLFSEADAKKKHMKFLSQIGTGANKSFTYKKNEYANGLLIKEVKRDGIQTRDVHPQVSEMQLFGAVHADGSVSMDLQAMHAARKTSFTGRSFAVTEKVEVITGEQKGLRGVIEAIEGEIVSLRVLDGRLQGNRVDVPGKHLTKKFAEGDHVRVIGDSTHDNKTGMVARFKGDLVTVVVDSTYEELELFPTALTMAAKEPTSRPGTGTTIQTRPLAAREYKDDVSFYDNRCNWAIYHMAKIIRGERKGIMCRIIGEDKDWVSVRIGTNRGGTLMDRTAIILVDDAGKKMPRETARWLGRSQPAPAPRPTMPAAKAPTWGNRAGTPVHPGPAAGSQTAYGGATGAGYGGARYGARAAFSANNGSRTAYGGNDGGRTAYAAHDGSRTAYGGADGSRTAYGADGSRTAYGGNDGSRTAYGADGSRTAYGGNDGSRTAYGADGSRTAYGGGLGNDGRTPGGPMFQAPTPAAFGAPTPGGAALDAPTPGANHATPARFGFGFGATPTDALTPGGWMETPGATADDEPGYD